MHMHSQNVDCVHVFVHFYYFDSSSLSLSILCAFKNSESDTFSSSILFFLGFTLTILGALVFTLHKHIAILCYTIFSIVR